MPLVSLRAYARHRGVALSAVQTAVKYNRITLTDGKVDVENADAEWEANTHTRAVPRGPAKQQPAPKPQTQPQAQPQPEPAARKRGRPPKRATEPAQPKRAAPIDDAGGADPDDDEPLPPGAHPPSSPRNIAEERLWNEFYTRQKLSLEVKQKRGELVPAATVERQWFNLCRLIRDNLLNLPNRYAAELASDTDIHSVHSRLTKALREVLTDLPVEEAAEHQNAA